MSADFARAKAILTRDVLGVCKKYLPRGAVRGDWWLAPVPWRIDKNPSLGVHLQSGRWKDFARPEERGDIIDLISRTCNIEPIEVVKEACGEI